MSAPIWHVISTGSEAPLSLCGALVLPLSSDAADVMPTGLGMMAGHPRRPPTPCADCVRRAEDQWGIGWDAMSYNDTHGDRPYWISSVPADPARFERSSVLVDSCRLVIVDPLYLSREAQTELVDLARRGVCVVVSTVADGAYPIEGRDDGVLIVDDTHAGELAPLELDDAADALEEWLRPA